MKYNVMIELVIDPEVYDQYQPFDLADVVYDELLDLLRTDIMSACVVKEVEDE